jgi:1-hydroxycarotenoid 3,4-desaturase
MVEALKQRSAPVLVVGAGIGGLCAALQLACAGVEVDLLEAGAEVGGKMRAVRVGPVAIDGGPTVFTMRWVFDQLLADAGARLEDLVALEPLSVLARHAWAGQAATLDLFADVQRSTEAVAEFAGAAEAQRFARFCQEAARIYRRLEGPHICAQRPSFWQMVRGLGAGGVAELAALGPYGRPMPNLWSSLGRHFSDVRLRQLFARYATYCGASPWQAPATLMLVAHVEMQGVWALRGGLSTLARRLAALAQARGVRIRTGAAVHGLHHSHGRITGVSLASGERLSAQQVVFNGDVGALPGLLGVHGQPLANTGALPRATPPRQRSLSALTWLLHAQADGLPLARHNVFFDHDYASEFEDIFSHRRLPRQGTVYVCAQDRSGGLPSAGPQHTPARAERLLALVNAPADGDAPPGHHTFSPEETLACQHRSLSLLQRCGLQLRLTPHTPVVQRSPKDFHRLFPGSGGALYGPATHGWMALFRRSGARTAMPGLYLCGGSVHPGPGVPMAAMSGRLAAATLLADRALTHQWHPAPTSGGTSTPSATTAATR